MNDTWARRVKALCVAIALVSVGCAEAPAPSKPAVVFPTRAEIAAIPAAPPNIEAFGDIDTSSEPWAVQIDPSTPDAPYSDPSAWGDLLRAAVQPHAQNVSLSAPLKCASDELAKVSRRSSRILPPINLVQFVVARCGAVVTSPRPLVWRVETTGTVPDDQILARAKEKLAPAMEKLFANAKGAQLAVGLGVARDDKGVSVVVTVANVEAILDSGALRADANHLVTIRGTVRGNYTTIVALVNQGPLGVAECTRQGELRPPNFAFTCKLADKDPYAWIELMGQRRGNVLSREIAAAIATSADDAPIVYKPRSDSPAVNVSSPSEFSAAIVAGVNRARAAAHLTPLTLDPKQSLQNARLVGTLVNSAFVDDASGNSDRAAVGLLAGWDVTGMIRGATIYVAALAPTRDATAWIDWALERPSGRQTLLDPTSRVIAIGPAVPAEGSALGAAVTTYALFESDDHSRDEATLYARIVAARAARGLPQPALIGGIPEMHADALRVLKESENPLVSLQSMLATVTARNGSSAMGYVLETTDIEHVAIPDLALRAGPLRFALAITHHKAEGAAWGQYVIFLIALGDAPTPSLQATNVRAMLRSQ